MILKRSNSTRKLLCLFHTAGI